MHQIHIRRRLSFLYFCAQSVTVYDFVADMNPSKSSHSAQVEYSLSHPLKLYRMHGMIGAKMRLRVVGCFYEGEVCIDLYFGGSDFLLCNWRP